MFTFYEKRKLRKIVYSKPVAALLVFFALLLGNAAYNAWEKASMAKMKRMEVAAELATLEAREAVLKERIKHLETEEGKEEELRKQFDVGKEGEYAIVLVEKEPHVPLDAEIGRKESFFKKFLGWF